ncbi:MAG: NUDIX domain-containing protein [Candidatus Bathyarchaeota archaeon]
MILKTLHDESIEQYCPECDHVFFDTPSPAVIVAVTEADRVLLTRSVGSANPYWGLISGHVKSGETAEAATIREVREEVGLEIFNLEILRTYTMKANNLLMIGFSAKTNSSSVRKSKELDEAVWFKIHEQLPMRPNSISAQIVKQIQDNPKR